MIEMRGNRRGQGPSADSGFHKKVEGRAFG